MIDIYTTTLDIMYQAFENTVFTSIHNPTTLHSRYTPLCINKQMIFMRVTHWFRLN